MRNPCTAKLGALHRTPVAKAPEMTEPSPLSDISSYITMIDSFIGGSMTASDFAKSFLQAMKAERRTLGEPVYPVLQQLFEDTDAYVADPDLRSEPEDLDDDQLLACARRARQSLRDNGFGWRPMTADESSIIRTILSGAGTHLGGALADDLEGALVSRSTTWILDVKPKSPAAGSDLPDGPFPARAFVPSNAAYRGEIIIWLTDGHISGLEYAWTSDQPPLRWPRPDEMEVIPQGPRHS